LKENYQRRITKQSRSKFNLFKVYLFIYCILLRIILSNKYLQTGVQRLRKFAKFTYQFPSPTTCKELRDIIEYERRNEGDGP